MSENKYEKTKAALNNDSISDIDMTERCLMALIACSPSYSLAWLCISEDRIGGCSSLSTVFTKIFLFLMHLHSDLYHLLLMRVDVLGERKIDEMN